MQAQMVAVAQVQAQAQAQAAVQASAARLNPALLSTASTPSTGVVPSPQTAMPFPTRPNAEMLNAQQQMQSNMAQLQAHMMEKSRLQQQAPVSRIILTDSLDIFILSHSLKHFSP